MRRIDRSIIKENTEELKELLKTQKKQQLIFRIQVFDTLDSLEEKLIEIINSISADTLKSLTLYPYIKKAFGMI